MIVYPYFLNIELINSSNTLAQRIDFGVVEGTFQVDGRPLPLSFQRATGFAEQQDVHEPTATVREALRFSALLRQPKEIPIQEKYDYVEVIIPFPSKKLNLSLIGL